MLKTDFLERPLRLSGLLIFAGWCVELLCLYSTRPIAFVIFLASGGLFLVRGIPYIWFHWRPHGSHAKFKARQIRRDSRFAEEP